MVGKHFIDVFLQRRLVILARDEQFRVHASDPFQVAVVNFDEHDLIPFEAPAWQRNLQYATAPGLLKKAWAHSDLMPSLVRFSIPDLVMFQQSGSGFRQPLGSPGLRFVIQQED